MAKVTNITRNVSQSIGGKTGAVVGRLAYSAARAGNVACVRKSQGLTGGYVVEITNSDGTPIADWLITDD